MSGSPQSGMSLVMIVCSPWRRYDGGDGGWLGGWVWVRVCARVRVGVGFGGSKEQARGRDCLWKLWWKSGNWRQYPPTELRGIVQWMGRARKSGFFSR